MDIDLKDVETYADRDEDAIGASNAIVGAAWRRDAVNIDMALMS